MARLPGYRLLRQGILDGGVLLGPQIMFDHRAVAEALASWPLDRWERDDCSQPFWCARGSNPCPGLICSLHGITRRIFLDRIT